MQAKFTVLAAFIAAATHVATQFTWVFLSLFLWREYEPASMPVVWLATTILLLLVAPAREKITSNGAAIGSIVALVFTGMCTLCGTLPSMFR